MQGHQWYMGENVHGACGMLHHSAPVEHSKQIINGACVPMCRTCISVMRELGRAEAVGLAARSCTTDATNDRSTGMVPVCA